MAKSSNNFNTGGKPNRQQRRQEEARKRQDARRWQAMARKRSEDIKTFDRNARWFPGSAQAMMQAVVFRDIQYAADMVIAAIFAGDADDDDPHRRRKLQDRGRQLHAGERLPLPVLPCRIWSRCSPEHDCGDDPHQVQRCGHRHGRLRTLRQQTERRRAGFKLNATTSATACTSRGGQTSERRCHHQAASGRSRQRLENHTDDSSAPDRGAAAALLVTPVPTASKRPEPVAHSRKGHDNGQE